MSPSSGCGEPLAMWTMPSTPNSSAAQPITWRPAGPLRSGSRRLRQATKTAGAARTSRAGRPSRRPRCAWRRRTPPGSCHQTEAATTRASPTRNRPAPSRRCSGSRSRAVCPIRRTPPPTSVGDAQPGWRPHRPARRTAGRPGPARCAPRAAPAASARTCRGAACACWLVFFPTTGIARSSRPSSEVLLLRDAGGEDVRVAMVANLREHPTCPMRHTPGVWLGAVGGGVGLLPGAAWRWLRRRASAASKPRPPGGRAASAGDGRRDLLAAAGRRVVERRSDGEGYGAWLRLLPGGGFVCWVG